MRTLVMVAATAAALWNAPFFRDTEHGATVECAGAMKTAEIARISTFADAVREFVKRKVREAVGAIEAGMV